MITYDKIVPLDALDESSMRELSFHLGLPEEYSLQPFHSHASTTKKASNTTSRDGTERATQATVQDLSESVLAKLYEIYAEDLQPNTLGGYYYRRNRQHDLSLIQTMLLHDISY